MAAGRGRRFDPTGLQNKLLQQLPGGECVALRAATNLWQVLPDTVVVVHPDAHRLIALLQQAGLATLLCPDAAAGMAHSLAYAVRANAAASGWIIALADMPHVRPATIAALDAAICAGADIAVPVHQYRRGNPVGFSQQHRARLLALRGDQGARGLLQTCALTEVPVDDRGIFFDIDTPADLARSVTS